MVDTAYGSFLVNFVDENYGVLIRNSPNFIPISNWSQVNINWWFGVVRQQGDTWPDFVSNIMN